MPWTIMIVNYTDRDPEYPGMDIEATSGTKQGRVAPGHRLQWMGNRAGVREVKVKPVRVGVTPVRANVNPGEDFRDFICVVTQDGTSLHLQVVSQ